MLHQKATSEVIKIYLIYYFILKVYIIFSFQMKIQKIIITSKTQDKKTNT